jgi:integrase
MAKKKDCIQERIGRNGKITYKAQVRLKGYPPQYETFDRKTDAKMWMEKVKTEMREGRIFKTTEAKKHTLGEMIDRYIREVLPSKEKSEAKQRAQLLWWKQQIGYRLLSDVTPSLLGEQRDKLARQATSRGPNRSPSTVVRYLAALGHAYTIAVKEWEWVEDSPMRKVKKPREPRGRVRFLTPDERRCLLDACRRSSSSYLYPVVVLALSTGMRQGEIMNLKWENVDLPRGRITLHETKNGERRQVPICGHAFDLLRNLKQNCQMDIGLLFPSRENPRIPANLRFHWVKAVKEANIDGLRFHDCRHSAASELAMNGASLIDIKNLLGHKQISVTARYSHLTEDHSSSVVASMNEKIFG